MSRDDLDLKLEMEIEAFRATTGNGTGIWANGSNPSRWGWQEARWRMKLGGVDIEEIYATCIKPYATEGSVALDIGTNGGFWLSKMLDNGVDKALGIDALSAEHLGFWQKIYKWHGPDPIYGVNGREPKVGFMQVKDFYLTGLEDNFLDYVFSYDVFCHISWPGAKTYLTSLFSKMKHGANAFIMLADKDKYPFNQVTNNPNKTWGQSLAETARLPDYEAVVADRDGEHSRSPGRWYFYGVEDFCAFATETGFEVVNRDVSPQADVNNTIVHFRKPGLGDIRND